MNTQPAKAITTMELRKFGLTTGALLIGLIGILLPWLWHKDIAHTLRILVPPGTALIVWALIHPSSLIYIYKPWMWAAEKIGWVNTRIILSVLFFVILAPIGFMMRLFGKDPLTRRYDITATSYRIPKSPQTKDHMETPF